MAGQLIRPYESPCGHATARVVECTAIPERLRAKCKEVLAVHVDAGHRGRRLAEALLERITSDADRDGWTLLVMPLPYDGEPMSKEALAQWYCRRFGWTPIQADPLILARIPGATPRRVLPLALAASTAIREAAHG
jgi:GNAT superfamily N-acetyltransferase